jgi:hypothetical protein
VSSLQTGLVAGAVGSHNGQHRFSDEAVVREEQPRLLLHTPQHGVFTVECRAELDRNSMATLWMAGVEEEPHQSGVIDVMELFGREIASKPYNVGVGLKPFADPRLVEDHDQVQADIDVASLHEYGLIWTELDLRFFVDDELVKRVPQSPNYPMQFMLGLYSFVDPTSAPETPHVFDPEFIVESFRSYEMIR